MFNPDIRSLTPEQRQFLFKAIQEYATDEIISQHYLMNGAHETEPGGGIRFFEWHRNYLRGLEQFLESYHHEQQQQRQAILADPLRQQSQLPGRADVSAADVNRLRQPFQFSGHVTPQEYHQRQGQAQPTYHRDLPPLPVKLPFWRPWTPIPSEFLADLDRRPFNPIVSPHDVTEDWFSWWRPHVVATRFPSLDAAGIVLSWIPHFSVHALCGGDMSQLQLAPRAPIFWPWHAFIDNIYSTIQGVTFLSDMAPPIDIPDWMNDFISDFNAQLPPLPDIGTIPVPNVTFNPLGQAKHKIAAKGLNVNQVGFGENPAAYRTVFWQFPMPGTLVKDGCTVSLGGSGICPCC